MAKMVNTYLWTKAEGGVPTQDFEALKNKVDSLSNVAAKTNITNTFTTNQNFNGHINVLLDNMIQLGYSTSDIKLILQSVSGTSNAKVKANKGGLILEAARDNKIESNSKFVVNSNGETISLNSTGDKFIAFKNGDTRESYIGRSSAGTRDFEINTSAGNIKLTTNGGKIISNSNYEQVNGNVKVLDMSLGFGGQAALIPDEGTTKNLQFKKGNVKFAGLDLTNDVKLRNVPNIKTLTVSNIANNTSKQQNLPGNSIVLMVRRNSNGANHNNWKLLNSGALTITNDVGSTENFIITYWEV